MNPERVQYEPGTVLSYVYVGNEANTTRYLMVIENSSKTNLPRIITLKKTISGDPIIPEEDLASLVRSEKKFNYLHWDERHGIYRYQHKPVSLYKLEKTTESKA